MARTITTAPDRASPGQIVEIRTLIGHPMETGFRPDANGELMPRDLIRRFRCRYNGEQVFSAELFPAISANPFIAFHLRATVSGPIELTWEGDRDFRHVETLSLQVG
ncbi:MAG: thiosulfate oxidation carrier complex protein SoxZ [Burkholderiaceae bacterium]|nr:thiosulfate oxidation carrier complex protein SoxZ [Burkholderiaceae bacterium]